MATTTASTTASGRADAVAPVPVPSLVAEDGLWSGGVDHGAWTTPVELDGGQLLVSAPPAGATPKLAYASALSRFLADADLADPAGAGNLSVAFGLGVVTIASSVTTGDSPRYQRRLAWIGFANGVAYTCEATRDPPPAGTTPGWRAFVMDATTGNDVLSYTSRGSSCGDVAGLPSVTSEVQQEVSIPWTGAGAVELLLRYNVGCGSTFDRVAWSAPAPGAGSAAPVQVVATQPYNPGVHCNLVMRASTPLLLPAGDRATHGPLGPFAVYRGPVNATSPKQVAPLPVPSLGFAATNQVHDGRWVLPAELDGGELVVTPAPAGKVPAFPSGQAMAQFGADVARIAGPPSTVFGYGVVTIATGLSSGGLPGYQRRLAWIGFVSRLAFSCPMESPSRSYPPPIAGPGSTPGWVAIVFDGSTGGDGVSYTSRGDPCEGPPVGPTVRALQAG